MSGMRSPWEIKGSWEPEAEVRELGAPEMLPEMPAGVPHETGPTAVPIPSLNVGAASQMDTPLDTITHMYTHREEKGEREQEGGRARWLFTTLGVFT